MAAPSLSFLVRMKARLWGDRHASLQ